ncbi:MAG: DUF3089 domain-containing protein [Caulobacteraceae bacterium]
MPSPKGPVFRWTTAIVIVVLLISALGAYTWREEILRTSLDPKLPFQTYHPPKAPNYADASAWAIRPGDPAHPQVADPPADVFFVHPTTYDGGRDWNGAIGQPASDRTLFRVMLPNYAGPFERVGRVFAPRYRQASLYASALTLRDDALDARRFAYGDVRAAFLTYLSQDNGGRPLVLAGVGQGAKLVSRLLQDDVATAPALRARIAAIYLIDTFVPADEFGAGAPFPACQSRAQAGCTMAWQAVLDHDPLAPRHELERAMVWTPTGQLVHLGNRAALCVNPLTGAQSAPAASAHLNLGAANASGLEWGVRPPFMPHQVAAHCDGGVLHVSRPASPSLQPSGSWTERRKAAAFNLFYADIEADAQARVQALIGRRVYGPSAPAITNSVVVSSTPIHHID